MAWTERFVVPGGAGTHNGTSLANAWTYVEGFTNVAAGQKLYVQAGVYSDAGARSFTIPSTLTNGVWVCGFNSVPGDLDNDRVSQLTPGVNMPVIVQTANYSAITGNYARLSNIAWQSGVSSLSALYAKTSYSWYQRCQFTHTGSSPFAISENALQNNDGHYNTFEDCTFATTDIGNKAVVCITNYHSSFSKCTFTAENSDTADLMKRTGGIGTIDRCLFIGGRNGISMFGAVMIHVTNNTFCGQSGDGIKLNILPSSMWVEGNYFHTVEGHAINANQSPSPPASGVFVNRNAFYAITGNQVNDVFASDNRNPITDSSDPFVNAAAGDYTLKPTSNAYGLLQIYERTGPASYRDLGAIQHATGGGNSRGRVFGAGGLA